MRYVIVHKTDGIFVGMAMGLAFFSLLDTVGQTMVASMSSEDEANSFLKTYFKEVPRETFRIVAVQSLPDATHVGVAQLKRAGLGHLIGDMERNVLLEDEIAGARLH